MIDWRDPAVQAGVQADVPVTLGLGLINVNAVDRRVFASRCIDPDLAPTRDRQGVPRLHAPAGDVLGRGRDRALPVARRASRRAATWPASAARSRSALRQIAFLLIPASVVIAVLAEPIMRLLYQRGEFTPDQTPVVAACARRVLRSGSTFNGTMLMLNRAFFSLQSNWVPTLVALGNLGLNAFLDLALLRSASGASRSRRRS